MHVAVWEGEGGGGGGDSGCCGVGYVRLYVLHKVSHLEKEKEEEGRRGEGRDGRGEREIEGSTV